MYKSLTSLGRMRGIAVYNFFFVANIHFRSVICEFTCLFIIAVIDYSHFYLNLTSCAVLNPAKMVQRPNYINYKGMQE